MVGLDLDDFRRILETEGVDVWTLIDTAMEVASLDYGNQLKNRRDGILERLYALTSAQSTCQNCNGNSNNGCEIKQTTPEFKRPSPSYGGGLFDDEQRKVLEIKDQLEIPHQSEDALVELLQGLADMDITFQALKETDIGRFVNRLRKHSSNDVKRLVKHLVRKWKDIVDEWVGLNQPGEQTSSALITDDDSPHQKIAQKRYNQVPDFAYSPNPHNGISGSDRNNLEPEPKGKSIPRRDALPKPAQSTPTSAFIPQNGQKEQNEAEFDSRKLASARKRLQENYKEAENAKRQRTIQVMDIHEIPKPKNTFFSKNKGSGGGSQARHW